MTLEEMQALPIAYGSTQGMRIKVRVSKDADTKSTGMTHAYIILSEQSSLTRKKFENGLRKSGLSLKDHWYLEANIPPNSLTYGS